MISDIEVYFLLLPDSLILDWAGPAEALRMANRGLQNQFRDRQQPTRGTAVAQGAQQAPQFRMHFVSPLPQTISSVGVALSALEPLPSRFDGPSWVVVVGQPGDSMDVDNPATQTALQWLRTLPLKTGALELLTICAGAVLAAHAGLLRHRAATTHHQHLDELQRIEPLCSVADNRIFVEDGPVFSSAGVTTGIDLVLQRIAQTCGAAMAAQVAQTLVVALRRGPHDPQLSPFLAYRNHLHAAIHRVQDAVGQRPQHAWTAANLAQLAHTSPRHLNRLFVEHTGVAPLVYVRQIRLAVADAALKSGRNVTQAAELAGFSSDTQLRRAWQRFGKGGTPSQEIGVEQAQ